jgi:hypothetical protein
MGRCESVPDQPSEQRNLSARKSRKWSDIKRGRVRRKAYAKLAIRCLFGGDFGSLPFLAKRIVMGERRG